MIVVPQMFSLVKAAEAFDETGALKDAKQAAQARTVGERVARLAAALKARPNA
jgi:hypothetical protein